MAAERLDPVREADEAGAAGELGAAASVVADAGTQDALARTADSSSAGVCRALVLAAILGFLLTGSEVRRWR